MSFFTDFIHDSGSVWPHVNLVRWVSVGVNHPVYFFGLHCYFLSRDGSNKLPKDTEQFIEINGATETLQ